MIFFPYLLRIRASTTIGSKEQDFPGNSGEPIQERTPNLIAPKRLLISFKHYFRAKQASAGLTAISEKENSQGMETHLSRQNEQVVWAMETVPVVDDEGNQREIACAMFTKLGYNVKAVSNGEEAVEYVE